MSACAGRLALSAPAAILANWRGSLRSCCTARSATTNSRVTAGTIFHDSHLPLLKWFVAAHLICESRKGMSANQIKRMLGCQLQDCVVSLSPHPSRHGRLSNAHMLDGTVEMDETYVGGKQKGTSQPDSATATKQIVIGIRQRGGAVRFFHAEDAKSGTLAQYIQENVSEDVDVIMTDEYHPYRKAVGNCEAQDRQPQQRKSTSAWN